VAYVAEKVMPSLGLIHFPKIDWTSLEFTKVTKR